MTEPASTGKSKKKTSPPSTTAAPEPRTKTESADEAKRLDAARAFATLAARHAAGTRCTNVVVLDLSNLSPVTDFFVIATGTSARQMRTVADELVELARQHNFNPLASTGYEGETWILVDCVDVVIHVFNAAARGYYDLDNLWGDAKPVTWQPKPTT